MDEIKLYLNESKGILNNYEKWLVSLTFNGFSKKQAKENVFIDDNKLYFPMDKNIGGSWRRRLWFKVDFFAKMPTLTSDTFFKYLKTEDSEKHKAFIDFALISNENILMVEVKGWNNYDEDKTKDLLHAFSKYKEQNEDSKVNLLVCYSGKFNGVIKKSEVQFLDEGEIKSISIRKCLFFNNLCDIENFKLNPKKWTKNFYF